MISVFLDKISFAIPWTPEDDKSKTKRHQYKYIHIFIIQMSYNIVIVIQEVEVFKLQTHNLSILTINIGFNKVEIEMKGVTVFYITLWHIVVGLQFVFGAILASHFNILQSFA